MTIFLLEHLIISRQVYVGENFSPVLYYFEVCLVLVILALLSQIVVFFLLQFVNFTELMSKNLDRSRKEAAFALAALMEIPSQYKATLELNILG